MKKLVTIVVAGFLSTLFAADGAAIYKAKCASCHGPDAKAKALGKSGPIAGLTDVAQQIADYKAGKLNKYGMGAVMSGSAKTLANDEEVKAVADYIASLK